jgi:hypothetical protein
MEGFGTFLWPTRKLQRRVERGSDARQRKLALRRRQRYFGEFEADVLSGYGIFLCLTEGDTRATGTTAFSRAREYTATGRVMKGEW